METSLERALLQQIRKRQVEKQALCPQIKLSSAEND